MFLRERQGEKGGEGANGDEKGCVRKYGENGRGVKEGQGVTTLKARDAGPQLKKKKKIMNGKPPFPPLFSPSLSLTVRLKA